MIDITIPGYREFHFEHLLLDYNGTLACDGKLIQGVAARLNELSQRLQLHVLTADTFGGVRDSLRGVQCLVTVIEPRSQAQAKRDYVEKLAPAQLIAVGNGRNDVLMMRAATLAVAVVGPEGAAVETLMAAHIASPDILVALDLLLQPLRLVATLRN